MNDNPTPPSNPIVFDPTLVVPSLVPNDVTVGSQSPVTKVPDATSIRILKKAFRRYKMSKKNGAGRIVTRYTRSGKPVY